ncbi:unnamed protein product [Calypogeia fissa]
MVFWLIWIALLSDLPGTSSTSDFSGFVALVLINLAPLGFEALWTDVFASCNVLGRLNSYKPKQVSHVLTHSAAVCKPLTRSCFLLVDSFAFDMAQGGQAKKVHGSPSHDGFVSQMFAALRLKKYSNGRDYIFDRYLSPTLRHYF